MKITFEAMSREYAESIASWRYEAPYHIYGFSQTDPISTVAYLTEERNRVFAVLSAGELIGFRSFGEDGRVPGGLYDESHLDTGGGLRPDLTGKGIGAEVITKGLEFGAARFRTERFRVTIAAFNKRALVVCERLGFREQQRFYRVGDREEFVVLTVDRKENLKT